MESSVIVDPMLGFAEPIASWLHLAGAVAVLFFAPSLVRAGTTRQARTSLVVFAASVVFLLAMSGTYHLLDFETSARAVFLRLDHAAIWVLIAGTFTPIHVIMLRGFMRWGMLAIVWGCALAGLTAKTIFFASVPESLSFGLYVFVGWLGAISVMAFAKQHGLRAVMPVLWGGVVYTAGATIWLVEPPALIRGYLGYHELFHVAVLVGITMHWRFIAREVAAARPAALLAAPRPVPYNADGAVVLAVATDTARS